MDHKWKLSFKGYRTGKLESITYFCGACNPYHFKTITPDEDAPTVDQSVPGAWTRNKNIEREKFSKDIAQPFKNDGTVNEKFLKAYGSETYKSWGVTEPKPYQKKYL